MAYRCRRQNGWVRVPTVDKHSQIVTAEDQRDNWFTFPLAQRDRIDSSHSRLEGFLSRIFECTGKLAQTLKIIIAAFERLFEVKDDDRVSEPSSNPWPCYPGGRFLLEKSPAPKFAAAPKADLRAASNSSRVLN